MGITLNNTGAGGTVNLTLDFVTRYTHGKITKYAYYEIPGKDTPTVDEDTYVVGPKKYTLSGLITDAEKIEIEVLEQEPGYLILLSDNELSNQNVRLSGEIRTDARTGDDDGYPWTVTIVVTATDH